CARDTFASGFDYW
nr:immunoglobulin heavy chain junction region [Macaca mulatta]